MRPWWIVIFIGTVLAGCATPTQPTYDPKTGTYTKTYTPGELGSNFVKDLLGINKE